MTAVVGQQCETVAKRSCRDEDVKVTDYFPAFPQKASDFAKSPAGVVVQIHDLNGSEERFEVLPALDGIPGVENSLPQLRNRNDAQSKPLRQPFIQSRGNLRNSF